MNHFRLNNSPICRLAALFALGLGLAPAPPALAAGRQALKGHVPKAVAVSPKIRPVEDSTRIQLAIGLPARDPQGLEQLLTDLYDPHSPQYRQFLTPQQYAERFGATAQDYQAVIDFAKSQGLKVEKTFPSHLLLDVSGTAAEIQRAFHLHLDYYQRKDGSHFYAPDTEPSVDLDVPLQHISGLDNFHRVWPKSRRKPLSSWKIFGREPKGGTSLSVSCPGCYQGQDFRDAYVPGLPATVNGAGQSVALLEFDDYFQSDITSYESTSNPSFTAPNPIRVLYPANVTPTPSAAGINNGNNDEVSLDIEMVVSLAPAAQVVVYEVPASIFNNGTQADYNLAANNLLQQMATDHTCYQISSSWGGYGDGNTPGILNQLAAQGQAYFEASGDFGSFVASGFSGDTCGDAPNNSVTDDQSLYQSKYETLVGGTNLTTAGTTPPITYTSETTWNDGYGSWSFCHNQPANLSCGGGACTNVLAIPSYQSSVPMSTNGGSSSWRDLPDVSACATNIFIYSEGATYQGGEEGTSAASPLWAAYWALANQAASAQKGQVLGSANPAIYPIGLGSNYNNDFHDIKDGSTNFYYYPTPGPYAAVTGFDLATGWGSPKGQSLITDLMVNDNTWTPTATATRTFTSTPTRTPTASFTVTPTRTPTSTPTFTATITPTKTPTFTPTVTATGTPTSTPTLTPTGTITPPMTPTDTSTATVTPTSTATNSPTTTPTSSPTSTATPPPSFSVQAWPNVTNGSTPIQFSINLTKASSIQLQIYDTAGELIYSTSIPGAMGWNSIAWPVENQGGAPLASGIYVYSVQAADGTKAGKILVQH